MGHAQAQVLNSQQVARYCGVTVGAVISWLQKGRLVAELEGAEYLVKADDLVDFMNQNNLAIPVELMEAEETGQQLAAPVLVIDEDRAMATNIERVLRTLGLDVISAYSSEQASVNFFKHKPQLITLDLSIDGQAGVELIKKIKATDYHHAKILVITDSMPSMISKARAAGADAILNKPFDKDALRRNVRILLDLG